MNNYKAFKLFIWVKPSKETKNTKQLIRIYIINSKKPASLRIVKKIRTMKTGYWIKIDSDRFNKFFNFLLSRPTDKNIKLGLFANKKIFKVTFSGESDLKVIY